MNLLCVCFGLAILGSQFGDLHAPPLSWMKTRRRSKAETQTILTSSQVSEIKECVKTLFGNVEYLVSDYQKRLGDWKNNFNGNIPGSNDDGDCEMSAMKQWLESVCDDMNSRVVGTLEIRGDQSVVNAKSCVANSIGGEDNTLNGVLDTFVENLGYSRSRSRSRN